MTKNARVLNLTRGFTLKHGQAEKAIANCSARWVEYGVSVRDLTLQEAIAARNEQAKSREPLPDAEIPGIRVTGILSLPMERKLAWEAGKFAAEMS